MKIRHYADGVGYLLGNFVVEPETADERTILMAYFRLPHESVHKYKFHLHGYTTSPKGIDAFNFGYVQVDK